MRSAPMPTHLLPMLAIAGRAPVDEEEWAFEVKWDGLRTLAFVQGGQVRLASRSARDITASFPEMAPLGSAVGRRDLLLDGEIVALDAAGRPSFALLQSRMHVASPAKAARLAQQCAVTYMLFDVVHIGSASLLDESYVERRARLRELGLAGARWMTPEPWEGVALADIMAATRAQGLEGVVAKRLASPYTAGRRSPDWLKLKHVVRQEAVVGGWLGGAGSREGDLGALLLGVHDDGVLRYTGKVGTGFGQAERDRLLAELAPLSTGTSPFDGPVERAAEAHWVRPEVVVEVAFTEWTGSGRMRHPSYVGQRRDKDAAEVVREPQPT